MKSLVSATFKVTPVVAAALASAIIWASKMATWKAILLLSATGIGACIVGVVLGVGLSYLAKKYNWSADRLAFW